MYRLHIANKNYSSWSLRPWVLLRELGIDFEERVTPFAADPAASRAAFLQFSPTGKVPCLHDGETVVWDSLAIAEYLAERHAGVWPGDARARAWARCAAAEMHTGFTTLRGQCTMNCGVRVRLHRVSPELRADLDRLEALWGQGLRLFGGPFLAGPVFTAVDAFFAPVAFRLQTYALPVAMEARAYAMRLLELPSMRRWYQEALRETWRDAPHDQELGRHGAVVSDQRA